MKKILIPTILALLFILVINPLSAQDSKNPEPGTRNPEQNKYFRIAFYNVENLFDTIDDPATNDADYLPGSRIPWTTARYETKLNHIARVIGDLSKPQAVAVFGMAEVENRQVLEDLVKTPSILADRFQIIQHDSPDERGIDNAMLYDPSQFQPVTIRNIFVDLKVQPEDLTRDILYVKGISKKVKEDTLHIFVNHWPSRSEGQEASEPKRIRAAEVLKAVTDSIFAKNPQALIVIMGDLNDEPADKSVTEGLQALVPVEKPTGNKLYNLMEPLYKEGKGTLYYKDWDLFDQFIISGNFWNKSKGFTYSSTTGKIFSADYLLFTTKDGIARPDRTAGKDYYGGYSDHLPVYVDLLIRK
jgi:hypothetical protein